MTNDVKSPFRGVDLHLHTTASDGAYTPEEMVLRAVRVGMDMIAITDHDTVDGVQSALAAGKKAGIAVVSGIELSAGQGEEVHLLGYALDPGDPALSAFLQAQLRGRQARTLAMLDRLRAMGMPVTPQEASSKGTAFMGRVNLAYAMVARGYVASANEAFDRYLNPGKPAFVPRERIGVAAGIEALTSFGATVVLAHPGRMRMDRQTLAMLLPEWMEAGLAGLEAHHASHGEADRLYYDRLARKEGLLITGGSDCHGRQDGAQIGDHLRGWRSMNADTEAWIARIHPIQP